MNTGIISQIIGSTPLIRLKTLSQKTGCNIFGKAEFLNPGGSIKDRAAKGIIEDAEDKGLLKSGDTLVEGTAGNTGIGLATLAPQKGYKLIVFMPDNQSQEKYQILKALGVTIKLFKPCPFSDTNHFYHQARIYSENNPNTFWINQFENTANWKAHYQTTGPEIWNQSQGNIDEFVASAGSGGSIAGISKYLKEKNNNIKISLADPFGSGLYSYLKTGDFKSEGSSFTEGIGIMRLTANFKEAQIDTSLRISDQEMYTMLTHLAHQEGLLIGTSGALNVAAAYKIALQNQGSNKNIVTLLCDSAMRYQSKIFNSEFLIEKNMKSQSLDEIFN